MNILDWGTNYQMIELLENKQPSTVWNTFRRTWKRTFGMPEVIIVDAGKEFAAEFADNASNSGALVHTIGTKAPWQNGRTERHGGLFKELFEKAAEIEHPGNREELEILLHETEAAKNRLSNRSGYSPVQRLIGQTPRLPGSLLSDDI
jgi:IS30 family transposase